jgi:hypothetical protein
MASREQVITALFNILSASSEFKTSGRRNTNPEGLNPAQTPAFFLVEDTDKWDRNQAGYNNFAKREMKLYAILYNDVGSANPSLVPNSLINDALDAIEAAMAPDDVVNGVFTIGGRVQSCTIDGESQRSSGDTTGKALAVVPIRILFP